MPMNNLKNPTAIWNSSTAYHNGHHFCANERYNELSWYLLATLEDGYAFCDKLGVRVCI